MPNIAITYRCNLHCPYCFANEFVNKENTNISLENFEKAVNFITSSGPSHIGLIGGEPLVHPLFDSFVNLLIKSDDITKVIVFTNGLLIDRHLNTLKHPKVELLINCNSPSQIGEILYSRLEANLDSLFALKPHDSFNLGLNIYDSCDDYAFINNLLRKHHQKEVRISLTVPDFSKVSIDAITYYKKNKQKVFKIIKDFLSIGVIPYYDCNILPKCIWSKEEYSYIVQHLHKHENIYTTIALESFVCKPVIDILPDLKAIRCFGLSESTKVDIRNFNSLVDLRQYYTKNIDNVIIRKNSNISNDCQKCAKYQSHTCMGGCLGFRTKQKEEADSLERR